MDEIVMEMSAKMGLGGWQDCESTGCEGPVKYSLKIDGKPEAWICWHCAHMIKRVAEELTR